MPCREENAVQCPACQGENVSVQFVEKGQVTNRLGKGFSEHMNNAARGATAIVTCGTSNLFWRKSEGTNKTKTKSIKMAICQECGNSWKIK